MGSKKKYMCSSCMHETVVEITTGMLCERCGDFVPTTSPSTNNKKTKEKGEGCQTRKQR